MPRNNPKPDDRSDNVEKLQEMAKNTIGNMEAAEETMAFLDGDEKEVLRQKNERRKKSLEGFRQEILDEAAARKNGYSGDH
ncbi:small acid-soluble spore protein Tlp [Psychrobacillus sp. NPDC058041]|uniref:small acid-soluble spore protein Tlp n=1 Tax=Psychrobacillus sp. NPDC058041 TaxID=3346310 RepID=UPI0036DACE64